MEKNPDLWDVEGPEFKVRYHPHALIKVLKYRHRFSCQSCDQLESFLRTHVKHASGLITAMTFARHVVMICWHHLRLQVSSTPTLPLVAVAVAAPPRHPPPYPHRRLDPLSRRRLPPPRRRRRRRRRCRRPRCCRPPPRRRRHQMRSMPELRRWKRKW